MTSKTYKYSIGDLGPNRISSVVSSAGLPDPTIDSDSGCIVLTFDSDLTEDQETALDRAVLMNTHSSIEQLSRMAVRADEKGVRSVNYQSLIGPLLQAMVELAARDDALTQRVASLEGLGK